MDPLMELIQKMNEALARYQAVADRVRELHARLESAGSSRAAARVRVDLEEAEAEMRALNAELLALQARVEEERERRLRERIPIHPRRMETGNDVNVTLKQDLEDVQDAVRALRERIRATFEDWVIAKRRFGEYTWSIHDVVAHIEDIFRRDAEDVLRFLPGALIDEYRRKL
jgi:predicted  nucleic acid-binding Zn-ribbon protein